MRTLKRLAAAAALLAVLAGGSGASADQLCAYLETTFPTELKQPLVCVHMP